MKRQGRKIKDFFNILIVFFLILGLILLIPLTSGPDYLLKWEYLNFFGVIVLIIGLLISEIIYLFDLFEFKRTFGDYENSFEKSCKIKFISLLVGAISSLVPSAIVGSIILALPKMEIPWDKIQLFVKEIFGIYLPLLAIIIFIFAIFVVLNMLLKGIFFKTGEK